MKLISTLFLTVIIMCPISQADRVPPAKIKPIKFGKLVIAQNFEHDEKGFSVSLLAHSDAGKTVAWKTLLFSGKFRDLEETDVQEIYLASLKISKSKKSLEAIDEHGQNYEIELSSGKLLKPEKNIEY